MRKKNWIYFAALAILVAVSFIVLTSSASNVKVKESPTCSKKKTGECNAVPKKAGSGEMIMDNMSRQFISITTF